MKIRSIDIDKDYNTISKWCESYNMIPYAKDALSDAGFIIDDICAVWLYKTNSKVCYMENCIANKEIDKSLRNEGIDILFNKVIDEAKNNGYKFMVSSSNLSNIIDRLTSKFDFKEFGRFTVLMRGL